ncbi:MAG TPA: RluA family pseudouridine synthase [Bdellovibrionota bacterium]|nr:RluA family pseudouridine synthase [Bdellovibrionota bacterium]
MAQAQVLYRDRDLLVLDKPAGLPSAPLPKDAPRASGRAESEGGTAVELALSTCPELAGVSAPGRAGHEFGLLHRLDTDTSGCLAFALNSAAFARYLADWKERRVRKIYRAVVQPTGSGPGELPQVLDWPLAHTTKGRRRMRALVPGVRVPRGGTRGKPVAALTRILEARGEGRVSDLTIEIETGALHQIRCHLEAAGMPIVGDPVYTATPSPEGSRLWLHAWKLTFPSKEKGDQDLTIEAPLPQDWPVAIS